ncbi:RDD family protein [Thermomonospora cellulosilytica]|uniref:RDD domain-containing protein n=1 Tax=Thermomonospora cellulosilytica TaxID=1411118 RepID=A0A7W3N3F1_9ACTN|nr:RDD family protein [Thermomonospora cellulosilytica]MBA9006815.1 hypothetical protein [Thermomonospora cellulosilytica]
MYGAPPPGGPLPGAPGPFPVPPQAPPVASTAPVGRRLAAWLIDALVVVAIVAGIGSLTYARLVDYVSTQGTAVAAAGVFELIGSQGDVAGAARAAGQKAWDDAVGIVVQGFAALIALQLLYQFAALQFAGRTLGKGLLGLRVRGGDGARPGVGRSLLRSTVTTASESGLYSVACILLVLGQFLLSFAVWAAAVVLFLFNALPMLGGRRRTLADRVSGTTVERAAVLRTATGAAQAAAESARRLGRRAKERVSGGEAPAAPEPQPLAQPGYAHLEPPAPPGQVPPPPAQPGYAPPPPGTLPPPGPTPYP